MLKAFKSTVQILVAVALVLQLGGCFYWEDRDHEYDHDRHYDHPDHHDHDDPGIDVHMHG